MDEQELSKLHEKEQTEAAVVEACRILSAHTANFVVYARTGVGSYARQISGNNCVERVAIMAGVVADLDMHLSEIAIAAARETDRLDAET